ncbi:penicillin-binding transpeptidase domain-containing protein [Lachnospiraceae bacterium 38-14]|uniref:penicillin-binding transpeptidase domain-containing protein n=1 Tax=Roseburia sp. 1XD42-69 TaxID=2320088 RepID=UPI000EA3F17B|nr:penicillin-binding transpeptidase domain-containing protein [Roseburia sp. 1XD42-69]RKJ61822.1 penicillin-binding transpeptidase domain-containing protein [Roseburia sp. 1XD42-69]
MTKKKSRRRRKRSRKVLWLIAGIMTAIIFGMAASMLILVKQGSTLTKPDELLLTYMNYISEQNYKEMYQMLDVDASGQISEEDFIKRNSAIYEGIEVHNMTTTITSYDEERNVVQYQTTFDTVAGNISFENEAYFLKREDGYKLVWTDSLIYSGLSSTDKVRVSTTQAKRGEILDRNGRVLAGPGVASSVGIVPGKLENMDSAIEQIAELLGMKQEEIEKKLLAKWVKEDSFVPVKTLQKVEEIELMSLEPDEEVIKEYERQQQLLDIPGVMISDTEVRAYPLGDAAAHLVGYVQSVTAEDLEKHAGEGYTASSVIGRSGAEGLFESELKGLNGCRIYIVDANGNIKEELANRLVEHGKTIKLTIDSKLQNALYEQFREDKSCSVAMNPYTGEVLALVSTPSYDNNDFIMGLSSEKWTALNEDENKPLYNRFRQVWCPGSTFKPITAAIGLESGAVDPNEDYGNVGLSWQKDASWGSYHVTTLHAYDPVVLENALIYSDNIYFAKAALKIGADEMKDSLLGLGFQEELPFEIVMSQSQYSNTENIEMEIQLADSGYGQGQILVNPLHMACIYTAFCNEGNVIKPYLVYSPDTEPEYWISDAFSENTTNLVLEGIKKVINDSHGTGYAAHREDVLLAGKTGTAEIKASKEDTSGTELGWFAVFTEERTEENPILIVSMVEDVKGRGGSGYVVGKDKEVLESWFGGNN